MKGKAGTSCSGAKRISERGAFVIGELMKLRRLTEPQLKRLVVDKSKRGEKFMIARLQTLQLATWDTTLVSGAITPLVRLTELGRKRAADSLGRVHSATFRDDIVFYAHLLRTADLYLSIVTEGARDWIEVRERASRFDWLSSNEQTQFRYRALTEFAGAQTIYRQVVPDVTIETETRRYLVEIEKSTKAQSVVGRKVEQYGYLFSPLKTADERPAYFQKYGDEKEPVLLFVFDSEARATNARVHFEKYAGLQNFPMPEWRSGTADVIGEYLRRELLDVKTLVKRPREVALSAESFEALRRYVAECTQTIVDLQDAIAQRQMPESPTLPANRNAVREILFPQRS